MGWSDLTVLRQIGCGCSPCSKLIFCIIFSWAWPVSDWDGSKRKKEIGSFERITGSTGQLADPLSGSKKSEPPGLCSARQRACNHAVLEIPRNQPASWPEAPTGILGEESAIREKPGLEATVDFSQNSRKRGPIQRPSKTLRNCRNTSVRLWKTFGIIQEMAERL